MKKFSTALFVALALAGNLFPESAYWPCFNGPKQDNISAEKGLLKSWPKKGPSLLWKFENAGLGYGIVAIANDTIYIAGDIGEDCKLTALDMEGKVKWQAAAGGAWNGEYSGQSATPAYDDGMVYFMNGNSELTALDALTGQAKWSAMVSIKYGGRRGYYGYAESLIVDGNNLLCLPGGSKNLLVALNKKTGKKVWSTPNFIGDTASYTSSGVRMHNGVRQIMTIAQTAIFGVNAETGEMLWFSIFKDPHNVDACTPVYYEGYVFFSRGYGIGSYALKLDENGKGASVAWHSKALDNHHGGVVGLDGFVYGSGDLYSGWYCLDIKTGKIMWNERGVGKGSVTYADGMLYAFSEKGKVGLLETRSDKFNMVSSFMIPKESKDLLCGHPVVAGGRLYLREGKNLLVYDIKAK
ncbi:MAG: PQQ-binding-like beta-propeller repeat protein [Candidatus Firestonebacteria bacterium]